jgi:hypothetical protein
MQVQLLFGVDHDGLPVSGQKAGGAIVSFCQICRHESPGHEPNCPVLTGAVVRGALEQWAIQVSGNQGVQGLMQAAWHPPCETREQCFKLLGEHVYSALEHAYDALGALQDCCKPQEYRVFPKRALAAS